jgi:hypothetical protein
VGIAIGIMAGGVLVRVFKPRPRVLTSLIFFVELFAVAGIASGFFLGCPSSDFHGYGTDVKTMNISADCSLDCGCSKQVLQPVCSNNGKTNYFSPCYAGCTGSYMINETTHYTDCSCETNQFKDSLTDGYCPVECGNNFIWYIGILTVAKMISSTARIGNYLIMFRCVEEQDKMFAMSVMMSIFGLCGSIPYPLIFGAITDKACLIWEESCGGKGNCWLYDSEKLKVYLHGAAFAFMAMGSLFDILVIYYSPRMQDLYGDEEEEDDSVEMKEKAKPLIE